jgi:hypothetical protein
MTYWYTQWDWKITIRRVELFEGTRIYVGMFESTMFGYVWEISNWFKTQKHIIYTYTISSIRRQTHSKDPSLSGTSKKSLVYNVTVDQSTKEGVDFPLPNLTISLPQQFGFHQKTWGFTWFHMISLVKSIQFGWEIKKHNGISRNDLPRRHSPPGGPIPSCCSVSSRGTPYWVDWKIVPPRRDSRTGGGPWVPHRCSLYLLKNPMPLRWNNS